MYEECMNEGSKIRKRKLKLFSDRTDEINLPVQDTLFD